MKTKTILLKIVELIYINDSDTEYSVEYEYNAVMDTEYCTIVNLTTFKELDMKGSTYKKIKKETDKIFNKMKE